LGDHTAAIWPRVTIITAWAEEAMLTFPILRPMLKDQTGASAVSYSFTLPTDFREVITVEYPISQYPPVYLNRKNRLDPEFYEEDGFYDIDRDYTAGKGWSCYVSGSGIGILAHVKVQYLANHLIGLADDYTALITVPDEYVNILIAYVGAKAFREMLSTYMVDPTAHTSIISQMTDMVNKSEEKYKDMVAQAQAKLSDSRLSPKFEMDKHDRVY
jgi:hypothetical protein